MKKSGGIVMRGKSTKLSLSCTAFLFICMLACVVCVASAKTIYVPDNYTKIQWAVDNASADDTIIVRDGIYYESIIVNEKLTIKSENGPENCIVNGSGSTVFTLEADGIRIEGFTITGGGYGIYILSNNNTIINNIISSNNDYGIVLYNSNNNSISDSNISSNDWGICLYYSNNNSISDSNISSNDGGIYLYYSNNNNSISDSNISSNDYYGIYLNYSNNSIISYNNISSNGEEGIVLYYSNNSIISYNNISSNDEEGIELEYSNNNSISYNNISSNVGDGIELDDSNNNSISNNIISNDDYGIDLDDSNNNSISNNIISNDYYGIYLDDSNNNSISYNIICSNDEDGIHLYDSNNSIISNNNIISNDDYGIWLSCSNNNSISYNNISSNDDEGIYLSHSNENTIINNNISSNDDYGIYFGCSNNNTIRINEFINDGIFVDNSYNNTVEDNTVNGKPLVYLEDESDRIIDDAAGQVILVRCKNITIMNLELTNTDVGIELWQSDNCLISNSNISSNDYGIYFGGSNNNSISNNNISSNDDYGIDLLYSNNNSISYNNISSTNGWSGIRLRCSNNNSISNNNISSNDWGIHLLYSNNNSISYNNISSNDWGIDLYYSNNNSISYNNISSNYYEGIELDESNNNTIINNNISSNDEEGIELWYSNNNSISYNNISSNYYGIYLDESDNNIIYLNNFIDNTDNVYSEYSTNIWNSTEKINYTYNGIQYTNYLGNYWSDYTGNDSDGDGIGDTPYSIDSDKDNYPLMERFENYIGVAPAPNQPPIANFTYSPEEPVVNQSVTFDASSSYDPDGNITAYEWDFGDGNITSTTEEKITHIYASSGNYTVNLTVTDDEGAKNSTSKEVSVQPADKTPPIITFVPPTPANNSILNINWVFINITLNENGTAILNWNGVNETMLGCGKNFYKNVTNLSDGTYTYKVYANDTSNNWNVSETRVVVIDTTPPASISNLTSIRGQTWINWTWTNPQDADFNYTMVYLNGIWRTNTSHPFYNATNLTPNTSYEIGTRTVDKAGNINQSWVNQTTKTRPYPAPKITSFAPQSPVYDNEGTTRTFNITVDQVVNVSWWINGTEVFNQTAVTESTYTNSSAAIGTWNVSVIVSNANGTAMQTWIWHVTSPCFIATAAYGTPLHEDIDVLRDFRDEYLMTNPIGREFVKIYYTVSPPIADVIRENEGLRTIVREGLVKPLVYILKELQNQNRVKP